MVAEDGRELHHVFPLLSFEFVRRVYWVHGNACLAAGKSLCLGGGWIGGRVVTVVVRRRCWGLGVDRTSVHRTGIDGTIVRRTGIDSSSVHGASIGRAAVGGTTVDSSGIRETSIGNTVVPGTDIGSAVVPGATCGIHGMGIGGSVVPETAVDKSKKCGRGIDSAVVPETAVDGASVYGTVGGRISADGTSVGLSSWATPILLVVVVVVARSHRSRLSLGCDLSLWLLKIFIVLG